MTVKKPAEYDTVQNDVLKANLFWFTRDSEDGELFGHQISLLGEECS